LSRRGWVLGVVMALGLLSAAAAPVASGSSSAAPTHEPAPAARPAESSPQGLFKAGVAALERGAYDQAVDDFELLADRGYVRPNASFDRAVAYVARARSRHARPGDLGRAAAALSETVLLNPDDEQAQRALTRVREEIARRRARQGDQPVSATPSLGRAVAGLLSEDAWSIGAALGSLLLTFGLATRRLATHAQTRLGAAVSASIGAVLLLGCGGLDLAARHFRLTSEPAVVVVGEARLLDSEGRPLTAQKGALEHTAIPEGAGVHVLGRSGTLSHVEWGTARGWVESDQLRVLERP
jgi:hypothetical protein